VLARVIINSVKALDGQDPANSVAELYGRWVIASVASSRRDLCQGRFWRVYCGESMHNTAC